MALRCIVVTPERTEIDREAEFISLPMYDGELGVLKGRAPMIGRLGFGTLRLQTASRSGTLLRRRRFRPSRRRRRERANRACHFG